MPGRFSVVIPTLHSPGISQTIQAILVQTAFDQVGEIIVAGIEDEAAWMVCPKVSYTAVMDRPSPARNRNIGASRATGEWICFTDSDCVPHPDWIARIASQITEDVTAISGSVEVPGTTPYWGLCDHYFSFSGLVPEKKQQAHISFGASLNFSIRKDCFNSLAGFSEDYPAAAGEDTDFCWRLNRAGYRIGYSPEAVVTHNHSRSNLSAAWQHCRRYGEAAAFFWDEQKRPPFWIWIKGMLRSPLIGEFLGLLRILFRSLTRPLYSPYLLRRPALIPGIAVLDIAHTYGILYGTRHKTA